MLPADLRPAGRAQQGRPAHSSRCRAPARRARSAARQRSCEQVAQLRRGQGEDDQARAAPRRSPAPSPAAAGCGRRTRHARPAPRPRTATRRPARRWSPSRRSNPRSDARGAASRTVPELACKPVAWPCGQTRRSARAARSVHRTERLFAPHLLRLRPFFDSSRSRRRARRQVIHKLCTTVRQLESARTLAAAVALSPACFARVRVGRPPAWISGDKRRRRG